MAGALVTLVIAFFKPEGFRLRWYFIDSIHFGEIALVLGALACMSINWDRSDSYGVIALKIVALVAGLNASVLSAARGGWLAIPVVFAVWARLVSKQFSRAVLAFGAVGLILAMVGSYTFSASVRDRINTLASDLSTLDTNPNTSNGLRWQIYVAGLHTYIQNPIFGIGPDQFANLAAELGDEGYLTHRGVEVARMEIHNEILVHAIALGTFGLAAILLIYFVPLYFFLRAARRPDRIPQRAGVLGACFVVSFVVFGLSVETFDLKTPATFYALTAAVLLAIATNTADAEDKVLPS